MTRTTTQVKSRRVLPSEVVKLQDSLLTRETVQALTGFSTSTIARRVRSGAMPKPIRLAQNLVRWRSGDITAWLKKLAREAA